MFVAPPRARLGEAALSSSSSSESASSWSRRPAVRLCRGQHPDLPPHKRRTYATLRFRGNYALESHDGLAVDLRDLTSHDLCAYAAGTHQVVSEFTGETSMLEGFVARQPSLRALNPSPGPVEKDDPWHDEVLKAPYDVV